MYKITTKENDSFIRSAIISPNICNDLITRFEERSDEHSVGCFGDTNEIDNNVKESFDITFNADDEDIQDYLKALGNLAQEYANIYCQSLMTASDSWTVSGLNLQKYPPGGGFKKYHFESSSLDHSHRALVFMTYLNDCDGGTYFPYQDVKLNPETGLTVIWPAGFTHLHKGVVDYNKVKYIVTGWFSFIAPNK